ncbi:ABC transporter permease subunit [Brevibacterium sp. 5221]|uniref:ABC transporter permease subunit n=2 Tax=Brevibacteriaceae TaxID=85019 RepID=A0A6N9H6V5_9MICO|nr:ABC transporter permease subunit [Brevibacterium rongguiense]
MRQRARLSRGIQYAIFAIIVIVLIVVVDWKTFVDAFLNPKVIAEQFPGVLTIALKNTIIYTALGFVLALAMGIVLALMKISSVGPYRWIATGYIEFFRGVPALIVFIAFGLGIPTAFGFSLNTYLTVMLSLGIVESAYIAETLRAGLQAVPRGQYEAARSLGMTHTRAMISIIIPQAFRIILPPLTNEIIMMTKDSSLIFLVGLSAKQYELALFGQNGITEPSAGLTPLVVSGACYLVITLPLGWLARRFEARTAKMRK